MSIWISVSTRFLETFITARLGERPKAPALALSSLLVRAEVSTSLAALRTDGDDVENPLFLDCRTKASVSTVS